MDLKLWMRYVPPIHTNTNEVFRNRSSVLTRNERPRRIADELSDAAKKLIPKTSLIQGIGSYEGEEALAAQAAKCWRSLFRRG